jgi:hypothetical protein
MIIMQTMNADKRRAYIESKGLSKVIYSYQHDDVHCIQYHPKGIKGSCASKTDPAIITYLQPRRHDAGIGFAWQFARPPGSVVINVQPVARGRH